MAEVPVLTGSLPDAPDAQNRAGAVPGAAAAMVSGTVEDTTGTVVPGATVTLTPAPAGTGAVTVTTDSNGFFSFAHAPGGTYQLTATAPGFAVAMRSGISVAAGRDVFLPTITLALGAATTSITVLSTQHEIAEAQIKQAEKQRAFGVVPFFFVTYDKHPVPLTAGQKYRLSFKAASDVVPFIGAAFAAGVEQANNSYPGYGQGVQGFAKRYGAAYADGYIGTVVGGAVLPSLFHQDPRYFYKGTGTTKERAVYAAETAFRRKGDNGKWQPDYSGILGNFVSGAVSVAYYPSTDRDAGTVFRTAGTGIAFGIVAGLLQEFIPKGHVQKVDPAHP